MPDYTDCTVLAVDDTEANIDILVDTLSDDFLVKVAMDGPGALRIVEYDQPDLILLDVMMPEMNGYEVCERLKSNPSTSAIPVIFLTAMAEVKDEAKGLALGAVDYITKPFNSDLVKARVRAHIELKRHRDNLEELVLERTRELILTQDVTIKCMGTLAECRDPETGGHIRRTQDYVGNLATIVSEKAPFRDFLDAETISLLAKSAPLHDIGKVGVPDRILLKPGKLTFEEFEEMKKHAIYGRDALSAAEKDLGTNSFLRHAKVIAESHHEKWDGSGYPHGLSGEDIPLAGRLMALADVYDALISKRVYKPPFPHAKAVSIIAEGKGAHFDPALVDAFLEHHQEFRKIALEFADFDEEREMLSVVDA